MSELGQTIGLLLIVLAVGSALAFVAARRGCDRGAAQVATGVILGMLLVLVGLVVATVYFGPSD